MEDDFRKLVLGKYYNRCKSKQIPVSNLFLSQRLTALQSQGYLEGCGLDDLINMCEFKPVQKTCLQQLPPNINVLQSEEYNQVLEELSLDDIDTSEEPIECPICLEEFDEEKRPIERLSPCGHYIHHSCIYNTSKAMGQPPFCPICKTKVTNVLPPSEKEIREGKRQLAMQYQRGLSGMFERSDKSEDFRNFVMAKTYMTQPFINTQKMVTMWNISYPQNQITSGEQDQYKEIARSAYKERFINDFDDDVDEKADYTLGEIYNFIVENVLSPLPLYKVRTLGPLEIIEMWNSHSIYTINLKSNMKLYEALNEYRVVADKKFKVEKRFNELYEGLVKFDEENNTDIALRVKIKYDKLRQKEDASGVYPGSYITPEIFDKPFDKLIKKEGCQIM